jgi:hypothetical protein
VVYKYGHWETKWDYVSGSEKAFDTLDHNILLDKLTIYGIKGTAHRWLESYQSNRTQHGCVIGKLSSPSIMKTGIPQGSD